MTDAPPAGPASPPVEAQPTEPARELAVVPAKSEAQQLAEQTTPPASPPTKKCRWCGAGRVPRYKRGDHLGLVLRRDGELDVVRIRERAVFTKTGCYIADGPGFYVHKTIPRHTRLTFWPEGDPEPFTSREPKGYGAVFLARLVGGIRGHALKRIFAGQGVPLSRGGRIALLVAGLLIAAGLAFVWLHRGG
jgi:hypothetical protein